MSRKSRVRWQATHYSVKIALINDPVKLPHTAHSVAISPVKATVPVGVPTSRALCMWYSFCNKLIKKMSDWAQSNLQPLLAVVGGFCVLRVVTRTVLHLARRSDYTRIDPRVLNLNVEKHTWANLGLWRTARGREDYPSACAEMARAVGKAAGLERDHKVVVAGFGNGDELQLFAREFGCAALVGINPCAAELALASRRFHLNGSETSKAGLRGRIGDTTLELHRGSATALRQCGLGARSVDRVVCVDCAYHFRPRQNFLSEAALCLRQEGVLAVADICLSSSWRKSCSGLQALLFSCAWRLVAALTGIPRTNLWDEDEYSARLHAAGFKDAEFIFVGEHVFDGFARFVERQHEDLAGVVRRGAFDHFRGAAWLCRWAARSKAIRYVILSARIGQSVSDK